MDKKPKRARKWTIARRIVQWSVILLFLSPLLLVEVEADNFFFGSLASSTIFGITLTDPFAALQIFLASKEFHLTMLGGALLVFVFYLVIKGRVFCSWVCPVNTILELTDKIRKYVKLPDMKMNRHNKKYIALAVLILSLIIGIPVFEVVSPIGLIMRNVLFTFGIGGFLLLAILLFELFISKRGWCRNLCPLGGFYQSIGRVGIFQVKSDPDLCTGCDTCRSVCLSDPEILDPVINREAEYVKSGDCTLCGACVDSCNFSALKITVREKPPLFTNHFRNKKEGTKAS